MRMAQSLARISTLAVIRGAVILFGSTLLPTSADPNDARAAFAEYAADLFWITTHLGQFLGVAVLGAALTTLKTTTGDRSRDCSPGGLLTPYSSHQKGGSVLAPANFSSSRARNDG